MMRMCPCAIFDLETTYSVEKSFFDSGLSCLVI